jgi:hypothetical protein
MFRKEGVNMKNYFFITPDALTYKPNCDRPEPDLVDMQIIGIDHDDMFQDALQDLIELNGHIAGDALGRDFRFDNNNESLKFFSFKPHKGKIPIAS